jgi:hypothetical protein
MVSLNDIENVDRTKYRLTGRSVLSYRFIAPHSETLYIGDIKKIVDKTKGLTFFAKITDLSHDSNFADPKWDTRPFSEQFYGLGEDVFITVEAVPLGYVEKTGKFHKARTLPSKFSSVEDPTADDFTFLTRQMGEIEVGLMRSGQDVIRDVAVRIPSRVLPQHMGVFATTGMGKSNFMKTFCASCMKEKKFGLLIVDPHGEYVSGGKSSTGEPTKGLIHYTNGRDGLSVFTIRGEADRKKYGMNKLYLDYDDFRISDLSVLHELSQPQYDIIEALSRAGGKEIIEFFENVDPETSRCGKTRSPTRSVTPWLVRSGSSKGILRTSSTAIRRFSVPRGPRCRRSSPISMITMLSLLTSPTWESGASSSSSQSSPG